MTGDVFADFMQQIPVALIVQVCVTGLLLIGAFIYFAYFRPKSKKANIRRDENTPPLTDLQTDFSSPDVGAEHLPDLDFLLSATLAEEAPHRFGEGTYTVQLNTGHEVEAVEVIAILRDRADDRLMVQFGDAAYRTLVDTPDVKKKFATLMRELSDAVVKPDDNPPEQQPALVHTAVSTPALDDLRLDIIEEELTQPQSENEDNVARLGDLAEPISVPNTPPPPAADGSMPGDLPSYKLDDNPTKKVKKGLLGRVKFEPQPVKEVNIGEAIEAYLQHKLKHTPEYDGRKIHVHGAPDGGVRIEVDGSFYDAVSDVTDLEVRTFLGVTIQEWQERQN